MSGQGGMREPSLSKNERHVLDAVKALDGKGYGVAIRQHVYESESRLMSYGQIYVALEKLEKKGLVTPSWGKATPERGWRRKRYYTFRSFKSTEGE